MHFMVCATERNETNEQHTAGKAQATGNQVYNMAADVYNEKLHSQLQTGTHSHHNHPHKLHQHITAIASNYTTNSNEVTGSWCKSIT